MEIFLNLLQRPKATCWSQGKLNNTFFLVFRILLHFDILNNVFLLPFLRRWLHNYLSFLSLFKWSWGLQSGLTYIKCYCQYKWFWNFGKIDNKLKLIYIIISIYIINHIWILLRIDKDPFNFIFYVKFHRIYAFMKERTIKLRSNVSYVFWLVLL